MTPINLDKLLQTAPTAKADTAMLKLAIAQIYQGQVQQLLDGQFRIQLPTAKGPLLVNLPQVASASVQQLLQPALTQLASANNKQASAVKIPLQVQFTPLNNEAVHLTLQTVATAQHVALSAQVLHKLLLAAYSSHTAVTPSNTGKNTETAALITAQLTKEPIASTIKLPALTSVPTSSQAQAILSQVLSGSKTQQVTILLQLSQAASGISATVQLPGNMAIQPSLSLIERPEQLQLAQQLIKLFNQQHITTADSEHPAIALIKPQLARLPLSAAPLLLQLQQRDNQLQLQLLPQKTQLQLQVSAEDFNRPLQFVSAVNATQSRTTATDSAASVQAVQQAWRHLLPLLPTKPDALASLPELPEPVQQILQIIRHSQIDGQKVFSSSQVMMQLQSLLQFQPLQPAVNTQNSGGALAVAIQLLLGNLMQKQPQSTSQSANPRLAQLVANLEPAQASSLLRQLASHSATLQHSQLATLDTNTASQQQILLQLPLQQNEQSVFSQIQLEQRDADGKQALGKEKLWQLTMKFDLQQLGPLLVVAKLQQQQLQLQFFTEQALAKRLADKFLPILKDRCSMQGLQVHQAECILGKIPDSLLPRANSLLAIKV